MWYLIGWLIFDIVSFFVMRNLAMKEKKYEIVSDFLQVLMVSMFGPLVLFVYIITKIVKLEIWDADIPKWLK